MTFINIADIVLVMVIYHINLKEGVKMQKEYFTARINPELHAKFKSKVALEKKSMAAVLERLLTEYVEPEQSSSDHDN